MASASFKRSLVLGETGGGAFIPLHSVLGRVSRLMLCRFSRAGLASEATSKFLNLAFAVAGMTSSLATLRVNLNECFVFTDLGPRGGLWGHLSTSFLAFQGLLCGPVNQSQS
jgi:hypothetical protein